MTAENLVDRAELRFLARRASMRPRPMTAENKRRTSRSWRTTASRFNEAAADDRGKRPMFLPGSATPVELQ